MASLTPTAPSIPPSTDDIKSRLIEELAGSRFECDSLTALRSGIANFIFRGTLRAPLHDGTYEVIIKYGEASVMLGGAVIPLSRCTAEAECLRLAQNLDVVEELCRPEHHVDHGDLTRECFGARTPRLYHFNPTTRTQVLECLPNATDLKAYALKYFSPSLPGQLSNASGSGSPLSIPLRTPADKIGRGLGWWLQAFHSWSRAVPSHHDGARIRDHAQANADMRDIKVRFNYELLLSRVEEYPDLLEHARPVFEAVLANVQAELADESTLQPIHGDLWTGNVVLADEAMRPEHLPGQDSLSLRPGTMFVIDWEMCQLWKPEIDVGQMIAELYELYLYKRLIEGLWMIEGLVEGYGRVDDDDFAFRTSLHVGTHLVGFGTGVPGWGDADQRRAVLVAGRDIILRAHAKDRQWFETHDLNVLFRPGC